MLDELAHVLCRFYSLAELREFFMWRVGDEQLIYELPQGALPPIEFAHAAVLALARRKAINGQFFAELLDERPLMRDRLARIAKGFGVDVSSDSSAEDAEQNVSMQAILETLIACSVAFALVFRFHTTKFLILSATLVPFALLRSEQSIVRGARWYRAYLAWLQKHIHSGAGRLDTEVSLDPLPSAPWRLVLASLLAVGGAAMIRVAAVVCHLPAGVFSLLTNWRYQMFCLSFSQTPELVPNTGGRAVGFTVLWLYLSIFILMIFLAIVWAGIAMVISVAELSTMPVVVKVFILLLSIGVLATKAYVLYLLLGQALAAALLGVVSSFMRFSVKCTALFWLPLALIAPPAKEGRMPVSMFMRYCNGGHFPAITRFVAWMFVSLPLLHLVMTQGPARELATEFEIPVEPLVVSFVLSGVAGACLLVRDYWVIERGPYNVRLGRWTHHGVKRAVVVLSLAIRLLVGLSMVFTVYMMIVLNLKNFDNG